MTGRREVDFSISRSRSRKQGARIATRRPRLHGYRLEALKEAKDTRLYSRRVNLLNATFPYPAAALSKLPNATILDGEVIALDAQRRSDSIYFRISDPPRRPATAS